MTFGTCLFPDLGSSQCILFVLRLFFLVGGSKNYVKFCEYNRVETNTKFFQRYVSICFNSTSCLGVFAYHGQVAISPTFYKQLLFPQLPQSKRTKSSCQYLFTLLGSTCVKAVRRTLMKLLCVASALYASIIFLVMMNMSSKVLVNS